MMAPQMLGYSNVKDLSGGSSAWSAGGFPIVKLATLSENAKSLSSSPRVLPFRDTRARSLTLFAVTCGRFGRYHLSLVQFTN